MAKAQKAPLAPNPAQDATAALIGARAGIDLARLLQQVASDNPDAAEIAAEIGQDAMQRSRTARAALADAVQRTRRMEHSKLETVIETASRDRLAAVRASELQRRKDYQAAEAMHNGPVTQAAFSAAMKAADRAHFARIAAAGQSELMAVSTAELARDKAIAAVEAIGRHPLAKVERQDQ